MKQIIISIADSAEDCIAYAALKAESKCVETRKEI